MSDFTPLATLFVRLPAAIIIGSTAIASDRRPSLFIAVPALMVGVAALRMVWIGTHATSPLGWEVTFYALLEIGLAIRCYRAAQARPG